MLSAGQRTSRVRFDRRVEQGDDGYGNVLSAWQTIVEAWAGFRPKFGREQLQAGALESGLTGTLTVLRWTATAGLTEADRVVFLAGPYAGKACQIRSIVPTPDNREIELLLQEAAT
ncbi:MAG TPA: phage head closure protein [Bosea sp. (in: a-proteobacteria)]|jgi:SPP1 family predicted phage head-tail adaptor|uniref:phage head closure protein n=1 Tax=Bosea sp. (in: a-proteobacteria) TaxID=1871050 RepID=UPI002DDD531F|nr:phage head closure protein [Bosea sp. (in: a-proteobacteria)]HEV2552718.1 phage head closure protein [Bosea sp. (in: a-proteobacteria)]